MFRSIIVPLDLEAGGDRALPIAGALAIQARLPLELVTVSSPGMPEELDRYQLAERARSTPADCVVIVLHDNDVAGAILSYVADRPAPLVVMATRARGPFGEQLLGSVSEAVLARGDHPVLLVGPKAVIEEPSGSPTLVVGVRDASVAEAALPAVAAWVEAFDGPPPWLVGVKRAEAASEVGDLPVANEVHHIADHLKARGIEAECEVAHAKHPTQGLIDFADRVADAVLVVASSRWTDPDHPHLKSLARRLTHHAHHPVLVVAAEPARLTTV